MHGLSCAQCVHLSEALTSCLSPTGPRVDEGARITLRAAAQLRRSPLASGAQLRLASFFLASAPSQYRTWHDMPSKGKRSRKKKDDGPEYYMPLPPHERWSGKQTTFTSEEFTRLSNIDAFEVASRQTHRMYSKIAWDAVELAVRDGTELDPRHLACPFRYSRCRLLSLTLQAAVLPKDFDLETYAAQVTRVQGIPEQHEDLGGMDWFDSGGGTPPRGLSPVHSCQRMIPCLTTARHRDVLRLRRRLRSRSG